MLSLSRDLANDEAVWLSLFSNSLARTLALHRRFSGPRVIEEVSSITTDDTPAIIGMVGWRDRKFLRVKADETMKDYVDDDGLRAGIADKELMGLVIGGVDGFAAHPGAVLFIGVGNLNAVAWVIRGGSRGGIWSGTA